MTDERRYQEEEIREIFEAATTARDSSPRALSSGMGLTLAELTLKGNAAEMNLMGIVGILLGLVILVASSLTGKLAEGLFLSLLFGAMGTAAVTSNGLRLPRWAREREEQLDYIANRAQAIIASEPETNG